MIPYLIPFTFLSILAFKENAKNHDGWLENKNFYYLISVFFIIFIGLRYEVGCDWNQYREMFEKYSIGITEMLKQNFTTHHYLHELGHIFISTISSRNIYVLNSIYAILFTVPLFFFCYEIKRKYLALTIAFPYYIVVVGMGPIRQAACASILMFSFLLVSQKKYYSHFLLTGFSLIIHQFSILFNGLLIATYLPKFIRKNFSKKLILFILITITIFLFQAPSFFRKTFYYITLLGTIIPPAKSAFIIWLMNFLPALIFIRNLDKFIIKNDLKKIIFIFSVLEIALLPLVFINSVITYRLLIYIFPSSIYITSQIPDLGIFKIKSKYISYTIILFAGLSLILWLKFAYHASCWLPYYNILLN